MSKGMTKGAASLLGLLTAAVALRAAITFVPSLPNVEQSVTFTVTDSLTIQTNLGVNWDFGDGSTTTGYSVNATHVYLNTGTFTVRAAYMAMPAGGGQVPVPRTGQALVAVSERRAVTFSPGSPVVGQMVSFQAANFLAPLIRWNFGDGTPPLTSGLNVTHTYRQPGAFPVTVLDNGGDSLFPIQVPVLVNAGEATGPRAPFRVSYLVLRFEDGKSYKVVPKDSVGLKAWVDIKFEGSGLLQFDWLLDGAILRQETRTLTFARQVSFDLPLAQGLPTLMPGLHSLTLRLRSPRPEFDLPVIRYFVTAGAAAPPTAPRVVMDITAAVGLDGQSTPLITNSLSVPVGGYGLFKGQLRNESRSTVALGLLRVTIDGRVSDLQVVRNIGPGETRTFLTSVFRQSAKEGKTRETIFVSFYDLSTKPPLLLVARRMSVEDLP